MSSRPRLQRRTVDDLSREARAEIRAVLIPKRRRFQWVFDWRSWGFYMRTDWPTPKCAIYAWLVHVGPVELRRWAA